MTFKIKDKMIGERRDKRKLWMFLLPKAPLETERGLCHGHSLVHISFKQVHEVHMFQSTASWDVNRQPPSLQVVSM